MNVIKYKIIKNQLSKNDLLDILKRNQIETLGNLSINFLVSFKHGRSVFRDIIKEFDIELNDQLYKSVNNYSKQPFTWPTKYYEKFIGTKQLICTSCNFKVTNLKQIKLHYINQDNIGPKKSRNKKYYTSKQLQPLCANCHSLKHRTGDN